MADHRSSEEGFDGLLRGKTRPSCIKALDAETAPFGLESLMAKAAEPDVSSVQRIWRALGLQPLGMRQFKLSKEARFVDKLRDVGGPYVDPPAHPSCVGRRKEPNSGARRTQHGLP